MVDFLSYSRQIVCFISNRMTAYLTAYEMKDKLFKCGYGLLAEEKVAKSSICLLQSAKTCGKIHSVAKGRSVSELDPL